jgi:hypothetical protein
VNVAELKYELIRRGVRNDAYSLESGLPKANEQYCIVREGGNWEVYYAEKGQKGFAKVFNDEATACARFLEWVDGDQGAKD